MLTHCRIARRAIDIVNITNTSLNGHRNILTLHITPVMCIGTLLGRFYMFFSFSSCSRRNHLRKDESSRERIGVLGRREKWIDIVTYGNYGAEASQALWGGWSYTHFSCKKPRQKAMRLKIKNRSEKEEDSLNISALTIWFQGNADSPRVISFSNFIYNGRKWTKNRGYAKSRLPKNRSIASIEVKWIQRLTSKHSSSFCAITERPP